MVSIAESFYYRIFERKWRMGEALRGPSPCMPYSVSNKQKKKTRKEIFFFLSLFFFSKQESGLRRGGGNFFASRAAVWLGVCCVACALLRARSLAARLAQPNKTFLKKEKNIAFFLIFKKLKNLNILFLFLFTDLSMAGLPAELKHITQRRKRKQP